MAVADIDLRAPIGDLRNLEGHAGVCILVRLDASPLGYVTVPLTDGRSSAEAIRNAVAQRLAPRIVRELVRTRLDRALGGPDDLSLASLLGSARVEEGAAPAPTRISVAVCTRDRPADLATCLESIGHLSLPPFETLVIDNAPSSDAAAQLVAARFPAVRYVRESQPGLDWARNRAIEEARGEIIAFTDDDVVVDPAWTRALAARFTESPTLACVTGLVVPAALDTAAMQLFEHYGGFGRGFVRTWNRAGRHHGAGRFGTGANMAFRRSLFDRIGRFDPALDVGTPTNGGGDLEMYFRLLQEGYTLAYEPRAVVRHRHRADVAQLRGQLRDWGTGFFSFVRRSRESYPQERAAFRALARWWYGWYITRRYLVALTRPLRYPRAFILEELRGARRSREAYRDARRSAERIARDAGDEPSRSPGRAGVALRARDLPMRTLAVRTVEIGDAFAGIDDAADARAVRCYLLLHGAAIGHVTIEHLGEPITPAEIRDACAALITRQLVKDHGRTLVARLHRSLAHAEAVPMRAAGDSHSPPSQRLSIVIATRDRPDALRSCLASLTAQRSRHEHEIIVVDNNPASGVTPPVVAEHPTVTLVNEPRAGLSYARNAGIAASTGSIVVTTDDDVVAPPHWLDALVAPLERNDVMVVTGNTLPMSLETRAQRLFEEYGGLGRGYARKEADLEWFYSWGRRAVPIWELGATANAAFRASIFRHPAIGLLDPALGAGSPTGCSEDSDLLYRVLAAGFAVVYEPAAWVWHAHRVDMPALRRQLFNYSKGHAAYHLNCWLRYRDARGLYHLALTLPLGQLKKAAKRLLRRSDYPLSLIVCEVAGNIAGPWALWRARRRVRVLGDSAPLPPRREPCSTP